MADDEPFSNDNSKKEEATATLAAPPAKAAHLCPPFTQSPPPNPPKDSTIEVMKETTAMEEPNDTEETSLDKDLPGIEGKNNNKEAPKDDTRSTIEVMKETTAMEEPNDAEETIEVMKETTAMEEPNDAEETSLDKDLPGIEGKNNNKEAPKDDTRSTIELMKETTAMEEPNDAEETIEVMKETTAMEEPNDAEETSLDKDLPAIEGKNNNKEAPKDDTRSTIEVVKETTAMEEPNDAEETIEVMKETTAMGEPNDAEETSLDKDLPGIEGKNNKEASVTASTSNSPLNKEAKEKVDYEGRGGVSEDETGKNPSFVRTKMGFRPFDHPHKHMDAAASSTSTEETEDELDRNDAIYEIAEDVLVSATVNEKAGVPASSKDEKAAIPNYDTLVEEENNVDGNGNGNCADKETRPLVEVGKKHKAKERGRGGKTKKDKGNKVTSNKQQVESDDDDEEEEVIECPLVQDILVGIGQALNAHPGNQRMVAIIAVHRDRYNDADKKRRKRILKEILSEVQRGGTRFLKVNQSGTGWVRCSSKESRVKVLECLRFDMDARSNRGSSDSLRSLPDKKNKRIAGEENSSTPPSLRGRKSGQVQGLLGESNGSTSLLNPPHLPLPQGGLSLASNEELLLDPGRSSHFPGMSGKAAGPDALSELEAVPSDARAINGISVQNPGGLVQGPPLRTDVVIGREALLYSQEGNLHLQTLVQANVGHEIIPTDLKKVKAKAILDRMVVAGTRFLMKEVDGRGLWYHLSDAEAQTVIYRGLCEEERRIQILLYSNLPPAQVMPGLSNGLEIARQEQSLARTHLQMDQTNDTNKEKTSEKDNRGGPPKKKYKKRLRKVLEERRRLDLTTSTKKPSNYGTPDAAKGRRKNGSESSDDSSDTSDTNLKSTILNGPVEIRPYDVILGRGRGSFNHPGNKNLIMIFRKSKIPYSMASKNEKIQMARDIVADIQRKGGRFLKRHGDDTWEIISNKDAYKKVGHGIRDLKDEDAISDSSKFQVDDVLSSKKRERDDIVVPNPKKYAKLRSGKRKQDPMNDRRHEVLEAARKDERERLFPPAMKSYGENTKDDVPSNISAEEKVPHVHNLKRKESESWTSFKRDDGDLQPRPIDVVCGRGKAFNRHPGNRKMHDAVTKLKYQYRDATSQEEKSQIAHTVLRSIQDVGGKFLKYDEPKRQWEELTYKNALKKIYHSIRDSLYNDRAANLFDEEAEVTRKADRKSSDEGKDIRHDASSKGISDNRPVYSIVSGDWKDARNSQRNDHTLLSGEQNTRPQHESQKLPGMIGGGNTRTHLTGIVGHDARGSPHLSLHDNQARATLAAAAPLMQQHLMNMGRHTIGGQPWSIGPEQSHGHMTLSEYEAATRAYHEELRSASAESFSGMGRSRGLESGVILSGSSRIQHPDYNQYLGLGGLRRY
ncbi:hypothetical protein IV203_009344 [Nitzschia inconspicua]|uniref:DUF6824 domain-containing protein n=1 Tax=Nitzschia inconspicua TaxID=303405 RepID=A0A9K3L1W6_9STRA|nr:hypothetical protein IV203_009344 [Nitzschia inconspicua]